MIRTQVREAANGTFEVVLEGKVISRTRTYLGAEQLSRFINDEIGNSYDEGFGDGHGEGYDEGFSDGKSEGENL